MLPVFLSYYYDTVIYDSKKTSRILKPLCPLMCYSVRKTLLIHLISRYHRTHIRCHSFIVIFSESVIQQNSFLFYLYSHCTSYICFFHRDYHMVKVSFLKNYLALFIMLIRVIFLSFFHLKFPFYFFKGDLIFLTLLGYSWFTVLLVLSVQPRDSVMCMYRYVYTHTERDIFRS